VAGIVHAGRQAPPVAQGQDQQGQRVGAEEAVQRDGRGEAKAADLRPLRRGRAVVSGAPRRPRLRLAAEFGPNRALQRIEEGRAMPIEGIVVVRSADGRILDIMRLEARAHALLIRQGVVGFEELGAVSRAPEVDCGRAARVLLNKRGQIVAAVADCPDVRASKLLRAAALDPAAGAPLAAAH